MTRRLLSAEHAAEYLDVSPDTFARYVRPALCAVRIGRCVRFDVRELDAWVDDRVAGVSDDPGGRAAVGRRSTSAAPSPTASDPRAKEMRDWLQMRRQRKEREPSSPQAREILDRLRARRQRRES